MENKIIIFEENDREVLADTIEDFINKDDVKVVIDIKYSHSTNDGSMTSPSYSAMIIYKI